MRGDAGIGGSVAGGAGNSLQWREVTSERTDVKSDREDSRLLRAFGEEELELFLVLLDNIARGEREEAEIERGEGGALRVGGFKCGGERKAPRERTSLVPEAFEGDDIEQC